MTNAKKPNEATQLMSHIYNIGKTEEDYQKWEYLNEIYKSCSEALAGIPAEITRQIKENPILLQYVDSPGETKVAMNAMASDIRVLAGDLKKIHDSHAGKTGVINDAQSNADSIQVFEMYVAFQQRFNALVIPNAALIAEQLGKAADKISAIVAEEEKALAQQEPVDQPAQTLN